LAELKQKVEHTSFKNTIFDEFAWTRRYSHYKRRWRHVVPFTALALKGLNILEMFMFGCSKYVYHVFILLS